MKRIALLSIAFLLGGCRGGETEYTIEVSGLHWEESYVMGSQEGEMLYLYDYFTREKVDSALYQNGRAVFHGTVDEPFAANLYDVRVLFVEPGHICICETEPELMFDDCSGRVWAMRFHYAAGTPLNDTYRKGRMECVAYQEYKAEERRLTQRLDSLIRRYGIPEDEESPYAPEVQEGVDAIWEHEQQHYAVVLGLYEEMFLANRDNAIGMFCLGSLLYECRYMSHGLPVIDSLVSLAGPKVKNNETLKHIYWELKKEGKI